MVVVDFGKYPIYVELEGETMVKLAVEYLGPTNFISTSQSLQGRELRTMEITRCP